MNDIAGPFLWLAGITTRAISSVMCVCHEFGTLASKSIQITATCIQLTKDKKRTKGNIQKINATK